MGEENYGHSPLHPRNHPSGPVPSHTCTSCGAVNECEPPERPIVQRKRRRGNHYAQYTRKFSLGNGPPDWVQEYLITKEGGKMLGTLVALAVARMPNLETFTWDMPTGVLRDVWLALSSLGDQPSCRLERIWVRWHDNAENSILSAVSPIPEPLPPTPLPPIMTGSTMPVAAASSQMADISAPSGSADYDQSPLALSLKRVEHPTFSILPPLKSLNVLDIDELAYLEEMSILIGRSQDCMRELRVGIASHAEKRPWVTNMIGEDHRLPGVLGTLMRHVHNVYRKRPHSRHMPLARFTPKSGSHPVTTTSLPNNTVNATVIPSEHSGLTPGVIGPSSYPLPSQSQAHTIDDTPEQLTSKSTMNDTPSSPSKSSNNPAAPQPEIPTLSTHKSRATPAECPDLTSTPAISDPSQSEGQSQPEEQLVPAPVEEQLAALSIKQELHTSRCKSSSQTPTASGKLKLEVLELERVPITIPIVQVAFDWSIMTSLTILHCPEHEQLWKVLRRTYLPRSPPSVSIASSNLTQQDNSSRRTSKSESISNPSEYRLKLKKIHTDVVSPSLITFLKDTLAPNSLEWLFLQEGRPYNSSVTIDAIYRGPLRRHKASLQKLMIDSSDRTLDGRVAPNHRWKKWIFNREVLSFVTSGKMSCLRELGMAVDNRDWVSTHLASFHI